MDNIYIMFDQFKEKFPVNEQKWNDYTSGFKRMQVPAKTTLLQEGEISKELFLIEKGCVRVWFNNNGKDVNCNSITTVHLISTRYLFVGTYGRTYSFIPEGAWFIYKQNKICFNRFYNRR